MTDLTRKRGDSFGDEFAATSASTGLVIDITGYTFVLTVDPSSKPTGAGNNLFSVVGSITDAVNGQVEFVPTAVQTDITPGRYYYDVQMTDTATRIRTIDSGKYEITQDISK